MFLGFSAKSSWRSLHKTLNLAVWALSLNFLHVFTLFVINIHQNRLISPLLTTRDHFHFCQIWDCFDTISLQFQVLVKKTNDWSGKIVHFFMVRQNGLHIFSPTFLAEQETFYYSTLYLLLFADKLTFVKNKFTHRPPRKYFFWIWDPTKDM